MFTENKKSLIIVCDERRKANANYLLQLITSKDDEGNKVFVGKDYTVETTIWGEKHFIANEPQISSSEKIIFIGNSKNSKQHFENINLKYNECGIRYGWLGNRAVIMVEDRFLDKEEIQKFNSICESLKRTFDKKFDGNFITRMPKWVKHAILIIGIALPGISTTIIGAFLAQYALLNNAASKAEILKHQYIIAVLKFYMDDLNKFLEE